MSAVNKLNAAGLARLKEGKIYVAGHLGMVGSAIVRRLHDAGCDNLLLKSRAEVDLENQQQVHDFLQAEKPDYIYLAAARVGGIYANNTFPAQFIYSNLMVAANMINGAHSAGVHGMLFLGSSCIYPKLAPQPMAETCLLTGALEETNGPYAIAKIAGIKLCEAYRRQHGVDYRSVMPTNLYGPGDNFHPEDSHVIPALMSRIHEAKTRGNEEVVIWGSGTPRREFLHVNDLANACVHIMGLPRDELEGAMQPVLSHINIGTGVEVTIRELAETLCDVIGFEGKLVFDETQPDGMTRKLLDVTRLRRLGWHASIDLKAGLASTYDWFLENYGSLRR